MQYRMLWTILLVLVCFSGCGREEHTPMLSAVENVFQTAVVTLPPEASLVGDTLYTIPETADTPARVGVLYYDGYNPRMDFDTVLYTISLAEPSAEPVATSQIIPVWREGGRISGFAPAPDGSYYATEMTTDASTMLYHVSATGEVLFSVDLSSLGTMEWTVDMVVNGEGQLVLAGEKSLWLFDDTGTLLHSLSYSGFLLGLYTTTDGRVLVLTDDIQGGGELVSVLQDGQLIKTAQAPQKRNAPSYSVTPGADEFDMTLRNTHGLYGYETDTGETTEICSFVNSDMSSDIDNVILYSADMFAFCGYDGTTPQLGIATRVPPEEVVPKMLVTVQVDNLSTYMREAAVAFNRQNERYRVVFDDYSRYNTETDAFVSMTQLDKDIAVGERIPDIFTLTDDIYLKYVNKGVFCDLYQLMASDESFSREAILPCVLTPMEYKGGLYRLTTRFHLQTITGSETVFGEREPWTLEAFLALAEAQDTPLLESYLQNELIQLFFDYGIDNFVNESGVQFLDGRAARVLDLMERYGESDFLHLSREEKEAKKVAAPARYQAGEALYTNGYSIYDISWFLQIYAMYEDVPFRCVGYPGTDGGETYVIPERSFAISSQSPVTEGAWAFLKFMLAQENNFGGSGYPTMRVLFEEQLDREQEMLYYYQPTDADRHVNSTGENARAWLEERGVVQLTFTDAMRDCFVNLVENATYPDYMYPEITEIVQEELDAYFAGGQSRDKTLENMQKRTELVWSERK